MRAAMARTTTTAFLSPTLPTYTTSTAAAPFSSSSPDARANVLRRHAFAKGRPSLDDVYLQATGRTLMDAELAAVSSRDPKAEKKQAMR